MNFLSIPAIDFDSLGSQHLIWVAPTTAQPKQPLARNRSFWYYCKTTLVKYELYLQNWFHDAPRIDVESSLV